MSERSHEGWVGKHKYQDSRGTWYTLLGALLSFGLRAYWVIRWAVKGCRLLNGKTIDTRKAPRRTPFCKYEEVTLYFGPHLEEVRVARLAAIARQQADDSNPASPGTDTERPYQTQQELFLLFAISAQFLCYWSARESKIRPREKALRRRKVWNSKVIQGSHDCVFEYCVDDIRKILAGEESDRADLLGSPDDRAEATQQRLREAEAWFCQLFEKGPRLVSEVHRLRRLAGVSQGCFKHAKRNAKVRLKRPGGLPGGAGWYCLPGQTVQVAKAMGRTRVRILTRVRTRGPLTTAQIAKALRKNKPAVKFHLIALAKEGLIKLERRTRRDVWYWLAPGQSLPAKCEQFPRPAMDQALQVLQKHGAMSYIELASALKKTPRAVRELLRRMKLEGLVSAVAGKYVAATGPTDRIVPAARGDHETLPKPERTAASDDGRQDDAENIPDAKKARPRAGRKTDPLTAELYEFCYVEYRVKGRPRSAVFQHALRMFPTKPLYAECTVTLYANRHADNHDPPLPRYPTKADS